MEQGVFTKLRGLALPAGRTPGRPAGGQWTGWEPQKHGDGLPAVCPRTDWQQFARKGLNTATGAAGEGCNEKAAFITPGIQKAE